MDTAPLDHKENFGRLYGRMGVKRPAPMVREVLENKHGVDNPVIDLDIDKNKLRIVEAQGLVDGMNDEFLFNPKPLVIVSDGKTFREGHGWTFAGSTATMGTAPSTDIFGLV